MSDLLYWIWLSVALTPGSESYATLRNSFPTPKSIFEADAAQLRAVLSPKSRDFQRLCVKDLRRSKTIYDFMGAKNVKALVYDDPRYPERLRKIPNPPVMLYYAGVLPDLEGEFCVSCVGSRAHSDYCKRLTFETAYELAMGGATIVSGLAYGLDSIALAAADAAGGKTVTILGSGIDIIYPKDHTPLARRLARRGAVMTEYPPGTSPQPGHFPVRNRLISAMGNAVMVTGGTVSSGSLITARRAKEQGRPLYAMPGNLDDIYSQGPALLLREGALAVTCCEDILSAFEDRYPAKIKIHNLLIDHPYNMNSILADYQVVSKLPKKHDMDEDAPVITYTPREEAEPPQTPEVKEVPPYRPPVVSTPETGDKGLPALSKMEQAIIDRIPINGECGIDELSDANLTIGKVQAAVSMLEIKGYVLVISGTRVRRLR